MSYILEALKKAEAERKHGVQPVVRVPPPFAAAHQRRPAWRNPWLWTAFSAVLIGAAGFAWLGSTDDPLSSTAPTVAQPSPPPVALAKPETTASVPSPAPAANTPPPEAPPTPAKEPAAREPVPQEPVEPPKKRAKDMPAKKAPEKKAAPVNPAPKTAERTEPAEAPVVPLRELPQQIQQQIPQVTVGGYIYSANRAERSAVVNNRLVREGDEIAPGLTLERMTQSGMILNYKGYRYRSAY